MRKVANIGLLDVLSSAPLFHAGPLEGPGVLEGPLSVHKGPLDVSKGPLGDQKGSLNVQNTRLFPTKRSQHPPLHNRLKRLLVSNLQNTRPPCQQSGTTFEINLIKRVDSLIFSNLRASVDTSFLDTSD